MAEHDQGIFRLARKLLPWFFGSHDDTAKRVLKGAAGTDSLSHRVAISESEMGHAWHIAESLSEAFNWISIPSDVDSDNRPPMWPLEFTECQALKDKPEGMEVVVAV
jgi:hypothetical protein